jgi:hypothetical protein
MRLIDQIAAAHTPLEALNAVRDWLEEAGLPTAALAIHREGTDTSRDWNSPHGVWRPASKVGPFFRRVMP